MLGEVSEHRQRLWLIVYLAHEQVGVQLRHLAIPLGYMRLLSQFFAANFP